MLRGSVQARKVTASLTWPYNLSMFGLKSESGGIRPSRFLQVSIQEKEERKESE